LAFVAPLLSPLAALADDARVSAIEGGVSIQHDGADRAVAAAINAPVLGTDYVTTGQQSRAEVQFDGTTAVRLGENVQMRFTHIDDGDRQLQLAAGTIDVRLLRGTDGQTTIDTPSISIVPRASGSYRVSVSDDGVTFVTVRAGRADIQTPQGTQTLEPGTTLVAQGTASDPKMSTRDPIAYDSFDTFNNDRDRTQLAALDPAPAAGNVTYAVPSYASPASPVWVPTYASAGWAPYPARPVVWSVVFAQRVPTYARFSYVQPQYVRPAYVRPAYARPYYHVPARRYRPY
jgi:hypothetical protein